MKCVILAAGEGVRMKPLTNETPKPMLLVNGKPLLEHILNSLPDEVDEVVLVVGYLKEKVLDYFRERFKRFGMKYVVQEEKSGTYNALKLCENLLKDGEKFLMLYADDLHGRKGLEKCANSECLCMLVCEADDPGKFGVVEVDSKGAVVGIEEKPENPKSNLVSTGVMILDKNIFKYPARRHVNGEYYLTDSIEQMIKAGHKFKAVRSNFWLPVGYPEDLKKAEKILNTKK